MIKGSITQVRCKECNAKEKRLEHRALTPDQYIKVTETNKEKTGKGEQGVASKAESKARERAVPQEISKKVAGGGQTPSAAPRAPNRGNMEGTTTARCAE